ncbi:MAG TPA: hypothetical protein VHJ20_21850 [Polyangia bacterium]|nr:hypothetical protein [Polyangia bacterium]
MSPRSSFASFSIVFAASIGLAACGGGSSGANNTGGSTGSGGTTSAGGSTGNGGSTGSGGTTNAGGTTGSGGSTGTGGSTSTGGTTGNGGSTGSGGSSSAGGSGGASAGGSGGTTSSGGTGGSTGPDLSAGCNKDTNEQRGKWNAHNIMVTVPAKYTTPYAKRLYWTQPPTKYDQTMPYALYIWGQGCGLGTNPEPIPPIENPESAAASIVVLLDPSQSNPTGKNQCFSAGPDGDNADSPEIPFFDQVVAEVESAFCIDKKRVFMGGYSSGGWESGLMSCVRSNVIRGTGWAAAGLQKNHDACGGPVAALITRATQDNGTPLDQTMAAVESFRMRNGCGTTTHAWTPTWTAGEEHADTSSCLEYDGCKAGYPLVWCPTQGGHTNTENDTHLTRDGLWKLWTSSL